MVTCCSYLWGSWTVTKLFISLHTPLSVSRSLSAFLITQYFSFVLSFPLSASPFLSASLQWSIHFPLSLLFHPSSLSSAYHIQLLHPCPILLFDPVRNLFGCKQIVKNEQVGFDKSSWMHPVHLSCTLSAVWLWIETFTHAHLKTIFFLSLPFHSECN